MPKVNEEQKKFISEYHLKHGKNAGEIIPLFEEKFGYSPSTKVINKWKYFNQDEEETDDKKKKAGETGELDIDTEDSRTVKDTIDFSSGDLPDKEFNRLAKKFGMSHKKLWDTLVRASNKGYKKVNASTGEFSK